MCSSARVARNINRFANFYRIAVTEGSGSPLNAVTFRKQGRFLYLGYVVDGIFRICRLFCGAFTATLNYVEVGGDLVLHDEEAAAKCEGFAVPILHL